MLYKKFKDRKISALCFGCGDISQPNHIEYIQYAIKRGINYFDTSENYHDGNSEIVLGNALKKNRKKYIVSTKVAPEHLRYDDVLTACTQSLSRLQTDYIDIYYIHWPNSAVPIKETCDALMNLMKSGKILNIGICNFAYEQLIMAEEILGDQVTALQYEYNFIDRSVEFGILPFSRRTNKLFVAFSPLRYHKYMQDDSAFVLSWLTSHNNIIAAISSLNKNHIKENSKIKKIEPYNMPYKETKFINLNEIDFETHKTYSPVIDVLAEDLKRYGALKPIKLLQKENNRYEIADGGLRFLSWKHAYGEDEPIEAIILNKDSLI